MSKPDLNKNGTPRKHGNMDVVVTRLDKDVVKQLDLLADEIGMARSTLVRHIVYNYFRDNLNDGSLNQQISQQKKSIKRLFENQDILRLTDSLHETKTALNKIGNLLNQDVKIRNTYLKQLRENGGDAMQSAYENEKAKILNRYNALMSEQQKLDRENYSNTISELKAKCDGEIALLAARYKIKETEQEKNLILDGVEYDNTIKHNIDNIVKTILKMLDTIGYSLYESDNE